MCNIKALAQSMSISYELTYKSDTSDLTKTERQNYVLDIISQKSVFRTENRRTSDSLIKKTQYGFGYNTNAAYELYLTKDQSELNYKKYFVSPLSRDRFFIKIIDKLNWEILPETKIIGDYKCQKAKVEYCDRHWIAWFTKDISISEGPYYFHGLPGLIIQIWDENNNFIFNLTKIKKSPENDLYAIESGSEINWEQYKKLLQDYFNDPLVSIKNSGHKVVTDDGNGGYKPIDSREFTKNIQKVLKKSNNPIELNHKVDYH